MCGSLFLSSFLTRLNVPALSKLMTDTFAGSLPSDQRQEDKLVEA